MKRIILAVILVALIAFTAIRITAHQPTSETIPATGATTLSVEPTTNQCLQACRINPQQTAPSTILQSTK